MDRAYRDWHKDDQIEEGIGAGVIIAVVIGICVFIFALIIFATL